MTNKQSFHSISCRLLPALPQGADLVDLVRLARSRVARKAGGPAFGLSYVDQLRGVSGGLCSHGSRTPTLLSPEHVGSPSRATSALGVGPLIWGYAGEEGRREVARRGLETPSPTGPRARLHFPQFPFGFRRGGGASDGFRVWAWRSGRGGGGGRAGRGRWERRDRHGRFRAGDRLAEHRLPAEVGQSNVSRGRSRGRDPWTFPLQTSRARRARPGRTRGRPRATGPAGAWGCREAEGARDSRELRGATERCPFRSWLIRIVR